jgi:hypothetical protein
MHSGDFFHRGSGCLSVWEKRKWTSKNTILYNKHTHIFIYIYKYTHIYSEWDIFIWYVGLTNARNLNILCSIDSNTNSKQLSKNHSNSVLCTVNKVHTDLDPFAKLYENSTSAQYKSFMIDI